MVVVDDVGLEKKERKNTKLILIWCPGRLVSAPKTILKSRDIYSGHFVQFEKQGRI